MCDVCCLLSAGIGDASARRQIKERFRKPLVQAILQAPTSEICLQFIGLCPSQLTTIDVILAKYSRFPAILLEAGASYSGGRSAPLRLGLLDFASDFGL